MAQRVEDQPADGVPVPLLDIGLDEGVELVDGHPAVHQRLTPGEWFDQRLLVVVFVDDLPDELLDQVLQRHQTGGAAVLVDHHREVISPDLHLAEQVVGVFRLGYEPRPPHERTDRRVGPARPLCTGQVLHEADADDIVDPPAANREPAQPLLDRNIEHFGDRGVRLDGDHVGPGDHDLTHDGVAEGEHRLDQLPLLVVDLRAGGRGPGQRDDLVFGHHRGPPGAGDQNVGHAVEAAARPPQRRDEKDDPHHRRCPARRDVGVLQRPRAGHRLGRDVKGDHLDRHGKGHPGSADAIDDEHGDDSRRDEVGDHPQQQQWCEARLAVGQHLCECVGARQALARERLGPRVADPGERGLTGCDHGSDDRDKHDRDDPEHEAAGHRGLHPVR